jgi:SAM-dependent MidA family methyltransferase
LKAVAEKIAREINRFGAISFARFMELALYCPVYGYYEKEEDRIGRGGDFFTSVSVGPLFGELLAWQFAQWLEEGEPRIVEAGAHRGELAADILNWLRVNQPDLFGRLQYIIIEPSARRREWQQRVLEGFSGHVRWAGEIAELAPCRPGALTGRVSPPAAGPSELGITGIIISNELLDAMPVHRLGWDAKNKRWYEWCVALMDDRFVWTQRPPDEGLKRKAFEGFSGFPAFADVLPDKFVLELCPAAEAWWTEAAGVLRRGKLLTIDYGFNREELLRPERSQGTLRAYYQHRLTNELLARPGEQDITAHVNFSSIQAAGEATGLTTEIFTRQARFLTNIAAKIWQDGSSLPWAEKQKRQFQTLTHPEHLGERFRVLVQERG